MIQHQDRLEGAGKLSLFWQSWLPDETPIAAVVIAHGVSEHSGRYGHVAGRLVDAGYAVYALDHRGHGRSEGPRALIDRARRAVADIDALVGLVGDEHRGLPLYLLGHSMGGALALSYAIDYQDRLSGLILSGPLAVLEAASFVQRFMARTLSALAPRLPLFEIDPRKVSRDPEVVRAYEEDPLNYHGKLPVRTVAELAGAVESFPTRVSAITLPTLIMYGTADELVPPAGSQMVYERMGSSDKTIKPYEGLYHEIFNEPEQRQVLNDLIAWVSSRSRGPIIRDAAPGPAGSR